MSTPKPLTGQEKETTMVGLVEAGVNPYSLRGMQSPLKDEAA